MMTGAPSSATTAAYGFGQKKFYQFTTFRGCYYDRMVGQFPRIFFSWSVKTIGLNDRRLFSLNSL